MNKKICLSWVKKEGFSDAIGPNLFFLLLWTVGMGFFFIGMPKYVDDWWYATLLRPWFEMQGLDTIENGGNVLRYGIPWREIAQTWVFHYYEDNVRLANDICPFFLLFPKWVGSGLVALVLLASVMLGFRIIGLDWKRSPLVALGIFLLMFFMPWYDGLGCMDFQFNYVLPSFVGLLFFFLLNRHVEAGDRSDWRSSALFGGLGFLLGVMHETPAIFICASLCLLVVCYKGWRRWDVLVSAVGIAVGAALLLSVPGMQSRVSELQTTKVLTKYEMLNFFPLTFKLAVFLGLVGLFWKRVRDVIFSPIFAFLLTSAFVGCCFRMMLVLLWLRVEYWPDFASVLCILMLMESMARGWFAGYRPVSAICALVLLGVVFVHLVSVDARSLQYREIMPHLIEAARKSDTQSIFEPVPLEGRQSLLCGYLPEENFYSYACVGLFLYWGEVGVPRGEIYEDIRYNKSVVFPISLREASGNAGVDISGGQGVRMLEGELFISLDTLNAIDGLDIKTHGEGWIECDFGKGFTGVPSVFNLFTSPVDGRQYVWIKCRLPWYVKHFKTIRGARIPERK